MCITFPRAANHNDGRREAIALPMLSALFDTEIPSTGIAGPKTPTAVTAATAVVTTPTCRKY
jgi:hypothetical protein